MAKSEHLLVFIAEPDPSVRESMHAMLEMHGFQVGAFGTGREFMQAVRVTQPHGVVFDTDIPDMDAHEMLTWFQSHDESIPVFLTSSHADVSLAVEAMKRGAVDFFEKPVMPDQFLARLEESMVRSAGDVHGLPSAANRDFETEIDELPTRQRQILQHLIAGEQNKQIAHELGISERTVETHRSRMMKRLGVHNLAELIKRVVELDMKLN